MSVSSSSRKPSHTGRQLNLADILARVTAHETLTDRQRQDLASALRTVGKAIGLPLTDVPAHPAHLRDRLKGFAPAMIGLSDRRWANVLSLARAALKHGGVALMPGRYREPFAPKWAALFPPLKQMHTRIALSRLARYCSIRGIDPEQVDDVVFDAFGEDLTNAALIKLPNKVHRKAAVVWNQAAETVPGWPQRRVKIPDYRRTYALPWETFPTSLKADVDAYLGRLANTDVLEDLDFQPLKSASIRTRSHQIHAYLSALVHRGRDPQTLQTLRDVVAIDVVKDGLRFFLDRAEDKSTKQAHGIAGVIRAIARHWVQVEADRLTALDSLRQRLDPHQVGMTETNRKRLRQFDDLENVRSLMILPEKLLAEANGVKTPTPAAALLVQTAVAIEILLMVPLRRRNLVQLDLNRHLVRINKGRTQLRIPGAEVKNGADIEATLPDRSVRLIERYLEIYRPLLLTDASSFLFPGLTNRPKSCERLSLQISTTIKERCGLQMHLHLFRHVAAKLYLDVNPGAYGVIRLLLGHRSVETTTKFYCGMETAAAVRRFDDHVLALHERLATPASCAKPRRGG